MRNNKQQNFDIMQAVHYAYRTMWLNRASFARLSILPILIKCGCIAAVIFFGVQGNLLRQGLMQLPAFFAEGFLFAYVIRVLQSGGSLAADVRDVRDFHDDYTIMMGGTISYVLVQVLSVFATAMTMQSLPDLSGNVEVLSPDQASQIFIVSIGFMVFAIWAFRFLWLYVALAMDIRIREFLYAVRRANASWPLIVCWLLCVLPLILMMIIGSNIIDGIFPVAEGGNITGDDMAATDQPEISLGMLMITCFQGAVETLAGLIVTIAVFKGFQDWIVKK